MMIMDSVGIVPMGALAYNLGSGGDPAAFHRPFDIVKKFQVTLFFVQEMIISGLYIDETVKLVSLRRGVPERGIGSLGRESTMRKLMVHLIVMNVTAVLLDITVCALEYAGEFELQTACKAFVSSVKSKFEFSILNKEVEFATRRLNRQSSLTTPRAMDEVARERVQGRDYGFIGEGRHVDVSVQAIAVATEFGERRSPAVVESDKKRWP